MEENINAILEFWRQMDSFSTEFPIRKNSLILKSDREEMLPWNLIKERRHEVYMGRIPKIELLDQLCGLAGADKTETAGDESVCMAGFAVDEDGVYVEGSFRYCPFFAVAATVLREKTFQVDLRSGAVAQQEQMMDGFLRACQSSLTKDDLAVVLQKIISWFHFPYEDSFMAMINTQIVSREFEESPKAPSRIELATGVYEDEIAWVQGQLQDKDTVSRYAGALYGKGLAGVDLDQNPAAGEEWLSPSRFPMGSWPSERFAGWNRQLAVNVCSGTSPGQAPFVAVNAPSWEETCDFVKDLAAAQVVERAEILAKHPPHQYFTEVKISGYPDGKPELSRYYEVPEELTSFGILVTCEKKAERDRMVKTLSGDKRIFPASYFADMASEVLEQDFSGGGFMAAPLGEKTDIRIFNRLIASNSPYSMLGKHYQSETMSWEETTGAFWDAWKAVEACRAEYERHQEEILRSDRKRAWLKEQESVCAALMEQKERLQCELEERLQFLTQNEEQTARVEDQIKYLKDHLTRWEKVKVFVGNGDMAKEMKQLQTQREELLLAHGEAGGAKTRLEQEIKRLSDETDAVSLAVREAVSELEQTKELEERLGLREWRETKRPKLCPWGDSRYRELREALFLRALQVQKCFVLQSEAVRQNLNMLHHFWGSNEFAQVHRREMFPHLLNTLSLLTPVLLSDLPSVANWMAYAGKGCFGTLIVLDGGHIHPWSVLGGMARTKRTIFTGDLKKLPPRNDASELIARTLSQEYGILAEYGSWKLSAQELGVLVSFVNQKLGNRRAGCLLMAGNGCQNPMSAISNRIAYGDGMADTAGEATGQNEFVLPYSGWISIADDEAGERNHYVNKQGEEALRIFHAAVERFGDSMLSHGQNHLYLVTPFSSIAEILRQEIFELYQHYPCFVRVSKDEVWKDWVEMSVGTVEEFQGRQASEVVLILGCDQKTGKKAALEAGKTPALLNTAVSMAVSRLAVIGDRRLWEKVPYFDQASRMLPDLEG